MGEIRKTVARAWKTRKPWRIAGDGKTVLRGWDGETQKTIEFIFNNGNGMVETAYPIAGK
jgi:hypothetical protein